MKTMSQTAQKLARPSFLRKGLEAVRIGNGKDQKYIIRCKLKGKSYKFDPWQFFILEVLPAYGTYAELAPVFEDRFGHLISESEVKELISLVFEIGLFAERAFSHPMLASYKNVNKTLMVGKVARKESHGPGKMHINDPGSTGAVELQHKPNAIRQTDLYLDAEADPLVAANVKPPTRSGFKENPPVDAIHRKGNEDQQHLLRAMQKAKMSSDIDYGGPFENRTASPEPPPRGKTDTSYRITKGASPESHVTPLTSIKAKSNLKNINDSPEGGVDKTTSVGFQDKAGQDDSGRQRGFKLFNPGWMINLLYPLLLPFRHTIYLLPLLLIAALFLTYHRIYLLAADFQVWFSSVSFFKHVLLGMVTVNLAVTLLTAMVAHSFRATVSAFCLVFYMLFLPRFMVRIENMRQLQRRERIWLYAAPLLLRLGFFSIGILIWFNSRTAFEVLAGLSLAVAFIGAISFFITANPLVKSSGYHLLTAFINEPYLRERSFKALLGKFRGNVYKAADDNMLVSYALVSIFYTFLIAVALLYIFGSYLNIELGATGYLVIGVIALVLLWRTIKNFIQLEEAYERQVQFERWRKRVLPEKEDDQTTDKKPNAGLKYLRRSALLIIIVVLFLPYTYEPGGNFIVLPNEQQTITAEIGGIIESINYDGGEFLKKGTVIGQLSYSDYTAQVKIYDAKIAQQQAVIDDLKSLPRPEEVKMAKTALATQKTQAEFSKAKAARLQDLYNEGVVSLEDLEDARRIYEVDFDQVLEKRANIELVMRGATPEELSEAESKLQSFKEERDHNLKKIEQSVFFMPFDGKLISLYLKRKIGSFLTKGEPLAVAEQADKVKLEIEIPESDISYVKEGHDVRCRFQVYHDEDFIGVVKMIDANVTKESYGKVIKVVTLLENKEEKIKSGMTGYAKISGQEMPLWKVLSLAVFRFIKVEVWSWLP
jgi:putative peptide zinc metalloprotease protein